VAPHKILVAEDFSAFREFVCAQLHRRTDLHVVAVDDGLAAVRAAADLRPDLALLDIGLPTMNGLEAARRIRTQSPATKIVFLTQESASEFVDAALDMGADGYILKTRALDYMLPVVETMLGDQAGGDSRPRATRACSDGRHRHHAQCFADDAALLASAERFVLDTLATRDAAMVALARPHLDALGDILRRRQVTIDRLIEQGTLLMIDATDLTQAFAADCAIDWDSLEARWREVIAAAGAATGQPRPRVASFSETGALLVAAGQVETAMRMEAIAERLVNASDLPTLDLTCVYPMLPPARDSVFSRICEAHALIAIR
jgi:DNA-binding NarL/FixJ family response regulator